jgi:hypothetical protein
MQKKCIYGVIYGLHDPRTGALRYIGQTTQSLKERIWSHLCPSNCRKSYHSARWINSLLREGMRPNVRIRAVAFSREDLDRLEIEHIAKAFKAGDCLTNHSGGGLGNKGYRHTAEWKSYMSMVMGGRNTNTPEHMQRLRQAKIGVPRTEETKSKISSSRKGKLLGEKHHQYRHGISTEWIFARLDEGWTKVAIAKELGVSPTFVHRRIRPGAYQKKSRPEIVKDG